MILKDWNSINIGTYVDLSNTQYLSFRTIIKELILVVIIYSIIYRLAERYFKNINQVQFFN